jgi:N-acetylmuramoyl-L-alanine amidase
MKKLSCRILGLLILILALPASATVDEGRLALNTELGIVVQDGRKIFLEFQPTALTTWERLSSRFTGSPDHATELSKAHDHLAPNSAERILIPLDVLNGDFRSLVILNLFPADRQEADGWLHKARAAALPLTGEGMWQVAAWFTGDGDRFQELMAQNGLKTPELAPLQEIRIPAAMLHRSLRRGPRSQDGSLQYGQDETGHYAGYRLQPGEAMYSAVVVRFSGRTGAEHVVELAKELAARSDIADMGDIPANYLIKIPYRDLTAEFLPVGHPRRKEAEADQAARQASLEEAPVPTTRHGLEGVLVIIDPGHGGRDLGTTQFGLTEHEYVYDVACRLKELLETQTSATVSLTLENTKYGTRPSRKDRIKPNYKGTIQTHPPFLAKENGQAKIGVNLRWYLANSLYREAVGNGTDRNKVIFLSLHADARHASLRGVMVYVPGARYRTRTYGMKSNTYSAYKEVREKRTISFSKNKRIRSEAVSRKLAGEILKGFKSHNLAIPNSKAKPIRDSVIRSKGSRWLPAVLRGNAVPTKILVEMVNLSNKEDAAVLKKATNRRKLALALADGILTHFGEEPL